MTPALLVTILSPKNAEHYLVVSRQPYPSLGYKSFGGVKGAGYFAYNVRGNKQLEVLPATSSTLNPRAFWD